MTAEHRSRVGLHLGQHAGDLAVHADLVQHLPACCSLERRTDVAPIRPPSAAARRRRAVAAAAGRGPTTADDRHSKAPPHRFICRASYMTTTTRWQPSAGCLAPHPRAHHYWDAPVL